MKIRDILATKSRKVLTVGPEDTVLDAIKILVENNIGALLVVTGANKLVGIISERDILRETAEQEHKLATTKVKSVMTKDVIIGVPDDKTDYTLGIMTKNRIRHMPIMEGEKLAGIISLRDVVRAKLDEQEYHNRYLEQYLFGG